MLSILTTHTQGTVSRVALEAVQCRENSPWLQYLGAWGASRLCTALYNYNTRTKNCSESGFGSRIGGDGGYLSAWGASRLFTTFYAYHTRTGNYFERSSEPYSGGSPLDI